MRLWHQFAGCTTIFLDATSSAVKQRAGSKRLLYYEIRCQNLKSGGSSVLVAAFLSNNHTVSTMFHCLRCFRDNEKKVFGYRSQVKPCILKVDFSTALIISISEVFNIKNATLFKVVLASCIDHNSKYKHIYYSTHVISTFHEACERALQQTFQGWHGNYIVQC